MRRETRACRVRWSLADQRTVSAVKTTKASHGEGTRLGAQPTLQPVSMKIFPGFAALGWLHRLGISVMKVGTICQRLVSTVNRSDEVSAAARLMREAHVGYLPCRRGD